MQSGRSGAGAARPPFMLLPDDDVPTPPPRLPAASSAAWNANGLLIGQQQQQQQQDPPATRTPPGGASHSPRRSTAADRSGAVGQPGWVLDRQPMDSDPLQSVASSSSDPFDNSLLEKAWLPPRIGSRLFALI